MKGLSKEIELALNTIIEGLNYNFFSADGTNKKQKASDIADYVKELEPEKMKKIMESKTSSFNSAKKILDKWIGSPNAPSKDTIRKYINNVIKAGESALKTLRIALSVNIDFGELDAHKHDAAIKAKPIILESIFELSTSIDELKGKLESDDLTFTETEFEVGFPEKFARGELIPIDGYYKKWYNEKEDAVRICPFSKNGEIITIHNLNIQLPPVPKKKSDILFHDKPKSKQYWQRLEVPLITNENKDQWIPYIKEEFRRRKEGIWFFNNGEPVYLTGNHYFALQWCKMLDTGTYMDFRYAQLNMFYHLEACIIDKRCLGQLFVKSRRTGFTFSILSIMLNSSTSSRNNNFGMTSKSNSDASKAFLKYRYMLLNLPFFFMPLIKGKLDSPNLFEFSMPADSSREAKKKRETNTDLFLNNLIDYQPTTNDSYDGQAMFMYLGDECFEESTKIMMGDRTFKEIKDIKVGEYVMNGKGEPKRVASTKVGFSELYEVVQPYGKNYKVSKNHRLVFRTGRPERNKERIEYLTPQDYFNKPKSSKRYIKRVMFEGYKGSHKKMFIDPYVFGAWLGDGYSKCFQMVYNQTKDKELIEYIDSYALKNKFEKVIYETSKNWTKVSYKDTIPNKLNNTNRFIDELKRLSVYKNKRIPKEYLDLSRQQRLELLAGIIDTDGYKSKKSSGGFSISMSRKNLMYDIYHLIKGLGFSCSEIKNKKSNFNTDVYSLSFTDSDALIPTKIDRKKPKKSNIKDGRNKVTLIEKGVGKYVGITLESSNDEDRTLILSDYTLSLNCGKWEKPHDYLSHLGQITPTMLQGGRVVGKAFLGSTVGAMKKGGEQFKEIYKSSNIKNRNSVTKMTSSGLYSYFLPAQDNMEFFTDKYGVCHKEKPKSKTINVVGEEIVTGSLEYLLMQEKQKKKENDISLNEQFRAYPRTIEHAFRDEAHNSPFNITKIYEQLEHNESLPETEKYTVGNFEWLDGIDSDVVFHPNPRGRFKIAWIPSEVDDTLHFRNNVREHNGFFYPNNKDLVRFGADPFSYKSTHGKGSKGGIHGKTVLLSEGNAPNNKFVVEYIARPSDETIFFEDAIKCIRFYGSPILVESNKKDLLRHMFNRGYRGFSMNRLDRRKDKLNLDELKYGGQMMSGKDILDSHMSAIGTWIQNYVGIYNDEVNKLRKIGEMGDMPFEETLKDWLSFDPDKRTDFDATISSGLAIMACQEHKYKGGKQKTKSKIDISSFVTKYSNKGDFGKII